MYSKAVIFKTKLLFAKEIKPSILNMSFDNKAKFAHLFRKQLRFQRQSVDARNKMSFKALQLLSPENCLSYIDFNISSDSTSS
ncbi:CLUMA_CG013590, isoform A [Clunio marinus]|uniref:CLUMA_CG013590, isoform A n=1 Tax=Clunio marinus TaxID=568069 RepID=A0A1J1IJA0_9DIPT|nr:CLUMA_CG013590, isoform A [Clunio marinus]